MKREYLLFQVCLGLFDGGAAGGSGAGAGAGGGAAGGGGSGAPAAPAAAAAPDAPSGQTAQDGGAAAGDNGEALLKEFRELTKGKYKDAYTKETQRIINERFKESKKQQARLQEQQRQLDAVRPLTELLSQRYGIEGGDMGKLIEAVTNDDPTLARRAEEHGLTVEQQRAMDNYERENRRLRALEEQRVRADQARANVERWAAEAAAIRESGRYPGFDLNKEVQNSDFVRLLHAGIPMEQAYITLHVNELMQSAQARAAGQAEKRVVDNIRTQGMRPRENGAANQGAFVTRMDPHNLTKEERAKIRERVSRGERVVF